MSDAASAQEAPGLAILLVDDEPHVAAELATGLRRHGLNVRTATSIVEARAALAADPDIAVLMTDIRMPGGSGLDLAAEALDQGDETLAREAVVITGHATLEDAATAMRTGACDFLRKPFRIAAAAEAVCRGLARATARRQVARERAAVTLRLADAAADRRRIGERLRLALERLPLEAPGLLPAASGLAELLPAGAAAGRAEDQEFALLVRQDGQRLLRGIDRLLLYDDLGQLDQLGTPQTAGAGELLRSAAALLGDEPRLAGVSLAIEAPPGLAVRGDACFLRVALEELLRNAIAASPPASTVVLAATAQDGMVRLGVRDQGPGLPAALRDRAGTPFLFATRVTHRSPTGLGLGLAIAHRVAALHDGRLTLADAERGGTLASLTVPGA